MKSNLLASTNGNVAITIGNIQIQNTKREKPSDNRIIRTNK